MWTDLSCTRKTISSYGGFQSSSAISLCPWLQEALLSGAIIPKQKLMHACIKVICRALFSTCSIFVESMHRDGRDSAHTTILIQINDGGRNRYQIFQYMAKSAGSRGKERFQSYFFIHCKKTDSPFCMDSCTKLLQQKSIANEVSVNA